MVRQRDENLIAQALPVKITAERFAGDTSCWPLGGWEKKIVHTDDGNREPLSLQSSGERCGKGALSGTAWPVNPYQEREVLPSTT
jgi:hypothetical protein